MRKPIIAGNWKMNNTPSQAVALINDILPLVKDAKCDVVVCPTFVCLDAASKALENSNVCLGAQNVHFEAKGAFTGEISTAMLNELNVKYVVIGHSERRQYFGETDEVVAKRSLAAINAGITPIICVGETLAQRENGTTFDVVKTQTVVALDLMTKEQVAASVIAYEPVWAIGTGLTATAAQAEEVVAFIRATVAEKFD
ncbi:MAG: triose-phosphate isomerase, partial [Clostridia bacterium]|nr:triose-phosphate isomerase [Clostridia bacterium]